MEPGRAQDATFTAFDHTGTTATAAQPRRRRRSRGCTCCSGRTRSSTATRRASRSRAPSRRSRPSCARRTRRRRPTPRPTPTPTPRTAARRRRARRPTGAARARWRCCSMVKVAVLVRAYQATTGSSDCVRRLGAALRTRAERPIVSDPTDRPWPSSQRPPTLTFSLRLSIQVRAVPAAAPAGAVGAAAGGLEDAGGDAWSKWPSWRGKSWPPRAHPSASEGLGLLYALVRRDLSSRTQPTGRGLPAIGRPS